MSAVSIDRADMYQLSLVTNGSGPSWRLITIHARPLMHYRSPTDGITEVAFIAFGLVTARWPPVDHR